MEDKSYKELQSLTQRMKLNSLILFTGTGFSQGAKNGNNDDQPLGIKLKAMLLASFAGFPKDSEEYTEWNNQHLEDVYSYC